jgi:hypothetical protein
MKNQKNLWAALVAGAALLAPAQRASAQTSEALMDALVKKGILTEQEARDIKADVAKENRKPDKITLGGKTVTGLNLYGDFRGRFEGFYAENPAFVDRTRFRYRLRVGATYTLSDNFELGLRLTSSEPNGSFGGDPISGNSTFQDNGSKKFIYIDQAYGKWNFLTGPDWKGAVTIGKMENPFVFSDMVFDGDYTPEGAGLQLSYVISDKHTVRAIGGAFVLDEFGGSPSDPYLYGGQIRWDAAWTKQLSSSLGIAALNMVHVSAITNGALPNVNRGNTRVGGTGVPAHHFNPIIADLSTTYTFDRAPFFPGAFPIKLGGDYMNNPGAPSGADNYAYSAGVTFGKAGRKGAWEVGYSYKWLGANSWWEELVDSDFGAFYQTQQPNAGFSGSGAGYGAGTNVKGHVVRAAYSPYDSVTLAAKAIFTELINPQPGTSESAMVRLQLDANWKF